MTKKEREKIQAQLDQEAELERITKLFDPDRMDRRFAIERCSCGHKRLIHLDAAAGYAKGHGACGACKCSKFTWVAAE